MAREEDDAPWLAEATPAAAARPRTEVSRRSLFWTLVGLLTLAAIAAIGLIIVFTKRESGSTAGYMNAEQAPLITAEPGPYKVPPLDPRGLEVEGQGQTIYAAGEGIDPGSIIDETSVPEAPLPRPGSVPAGPPGLPRDLVPEDVSGPPAAAAVPPAPVVVRPPPTAAPASTAPARPAVVPPVKPATLPPVAKPAPPPIAKPATPKPEAAKPEPAKAGGTVQLGAFSTEAKANAAWAALAGTPGLAGFAKRLVKTESDGQTLWRLRASGGDAAALCARLTAAGKPCTLVN